MRKLGFIARKEFYHIMRDPRSLTIIIVMPILMTFLFGYAINMDVEHLVLATVDRDNSRESRDLADQFYASTYFHMPEEPLDHLDPERSLRRGDANGVLVIKQGFAAALRTGRPVRVGLIIDGADNNTAAALRGYADGVLGMYLRERFAPVQQPPSVELSVQVLYNPDLESPVFFVPGLVAVILMMISALLTSITIAREKETGTMEQLLTAPVRPAQIIIGKLIPYAGLALVDGILVLVFAKLLFDVPFVGSMFVLLGFGFLYIITSLSIGVLISTLVRTQQVAMMLTLMSTMLPSIMLSDLIFALKNMPFALQALSYMVPARYFLTIIRGIMLKGAGLTALLDQAFLLSALTVVLLGIAVRQFKTGMSS